MPFDFSFLDQPPALAAGGLAVPDSVLSAPLDCDGFPIPPPWSSNDQSIGRYNNTPKAWRERRSREWVEKETLAYNQPEKVSGGRAGATNYTTQYALDWAKKQKSESGCFSWKIIDREHYNFRTKRHHDLLMGVDLLVDDGRPGMLGIQAAGKNEEARHRQRFEAWGGVAKARQLGVRVWYVVFERGNKEPLSVEVWA